MRTWEHRQLDAPENELEQVLQSFGENGRELVSVIDETIDPSRQADRRMYRLFFKRPLSEVEPGETTED
jgi:MarR-like DNA-binding transcriptional regulator SgrR of sgrS sRNA